MPRFSPFMTAIIAVAVLAGMVNQFAKAGELDMQAELLGIANCANKCDKVFDRSQYAISDQPNADTFEYRSCIIGCNQCGQILNSLPSNGTSSSRPPTNGDESCFRFCKRYNYGGRGIRKGLIEPDKACIMGCVINTCQQVCTGGTTDNQVTPANQNLWWNLGGNGCSIKGGQGYVQNPNYGNPDSPGGLGANIGQKACCTQLTNLCAYRGSTDNNINYQNVGVVVRRLCRGFVPRTNLFNTTALCEYYRVPQNCGTPGMGGTITSAPSTS